MLPVLRRGQVFEYKRFLVLFRLSGEHVPRHGTPTVCQECIADANLPAGSEDSGMPVPVTVCVSLLHVNDIGSIGSRGRTLGFPVYAVRRRLWQPE